MSYLPDELWRRILEIGITGSSSNLVYKDLCSLSITCRRFNRLSADNSLWSSLLSSDFPSQFSSTSTPPNSSFKSLYKFRYYKFKHAHISCLALFFNKIYFNYSFDDKVYPSWLITLSNLYLLYCVIVIMIVSDIFRFEGERKL